MQLETQDRAQARKDELQHQLELYRVDADTKVKMRQLELQARLDDSGMTHTEKKKNNKPVAERVENSRPSLNRIEASPILFSENSNEGSLTDSVPRSMLTRFLEENQEIIAQMGETTDTGLEEEINRMVEKVLPQEPETPRSVGRPKKHVYTNKKN